MLYFYTFSDYLINVPIFNFNYYLNLNRELLLELMIISIVGGWSYFFRKQWFLFKRRLVRWAYQLEAWGIRKYKIWCIRNSVLIGYYECWKRFLYRIIFQFDIWALLGLVFRCIPWYINKFLNWYRWYWKNKFTHWKQKPKLWFYKWSIKKMWALYYLIKNIIMKCYYKDCIMLFLYSRHNMATRGNRMMRLIGGLFAIFFHWYYLMLYRYMHYRAFCKAAYTAVYFFGYSTWWIFVFWFIAYPHIYPWLYVDFSNCCWEGHVWTIYNFQYTKWWWIIY